MARFADAELLGPGHGLEGFDCGVPSLNIWLQSYARGAAGAGSARTYVVTDAKQNGRVVGYHALSAGSVSHAEATARVTRGMPQHAIPVVLLARLAVDESVQGHGIGAWLLRDAMVRVLAASETIGVRALLVHALDDRARSFYLRHGLEGSPTDPHTLQAIIKDIMGSSRSKQKGAAAVEAGRPLSLS